MRHRSGQSKPQNLVTTSYPQHSMPLVFGAKLADEEIQVMIDCGANQNYASPQLAERRREQCQPNAKPYPLNMADGPLLRTAGWIRKGIRDVRLEIGRHEEQKRTNYSRRCTNQIRHHPRDEMASETWTSNRLARANSHVSPMQSWKPRRGPIDL